MDAMAIPVLTIQLIPKTNIFSDIVLLQEGYSVGYPFLSTKVSIEE